MDPPHRGGQQTADIMSSDSGRKAAVGKLGTHSNLDLMAPITSFLSRGLGRDSVTNVEQQHLHSIETLCQTVAAVQDEQLCRLKHLSFH